MIWLLSLAFVLGMTSAATADVHPQNLPDCVKYQVPGVGTVCGYADLEQWKAVLRADAELTHQRELAAAAAKEAAAEHARAEALADALVIREGADKYMRDRLEETRRHLEERDRLYQKERARPRWGTWISWGVAAIAVGVAGGVAIAR